MVGLGLPTGMDEQQVDMGSAYMTLIQTARRAAAGAAWENKSVGMST